MNAYISTIQIFYVYSLTQYYKSFIKKLMLFFDCNWEVMCMKHVCKRRFKAEALKRGTILQQQVQRRS